MSRIKKEVRETILAKLDAPEKKKTKKTTEVDVVSKGKKEKEL